MIDYTDPSLWKPPRWHRDHGDVQGELDHLRRVARCVIEQLPQLSVGLSVPEAGLMFLVIGDGGQVDIAEIYSINLNEGGCLRKYGVFLRPSSVAEVEHYSTSAQGVVDFLNSTLRIGNGDAVSSSFPAP